MRRRKHSITQYFYINQHINANELRVVGDDGTQYGVLSKQDALRLAEEKSLDVVLVAPNAKPPVAKLIEFSKFKFQQEKKEQSSKKKSSVQELKELRLTPFMAAGDLKVRIARAKDFLTHGDKVRLTVWFRGRQITRKQFGYDILHSAVEQIGGVGAVEQEPKLRGKNLEMLIRPLKKHETNRKTEDQVKPEGTV